MPQPCKAREGVSREGGARQPFLRLLYLKSKLILMNLRQRRQIRKMRQIHCACRENVIRIYYTINYHSCPLFFKRYHLLHPFLQKNTPKAACAPRALRPTFPDRKPENSPRPNAYQMNHAEKPPRLRKSRAVPCKIQPPHPLHANRAFSLLRSFFRNSAPDRCNPQPPVLLQAVGAGSAAAVPAKSARHAEQYRNM